MESKWKTLSRDGTRRKREHHSYRVEIKGFKAWWVDGCHGIVASGNGRGNGGDCIKWDSLLDYMACNEVGRKY